MIARPQGCGRADGETAAPIRCKRESKLTICAAEALAAADPAMYDVKHGTGRAGRPA